jgi:hypothetical protein
MIENHTPIPVEVFRGLWARGRADTCPLDHFTDCQNLTFSQAGAETRKGFRKSVTISSVKRFYVYKRPDEASRLLILDSSGNLYDSLKLPTPIATITGMTDFAMVSFFGRAYISPHNGQEGLPSTNVYVYDGVDFRIAGGTPPVVGPTVATSGLSGAIEAGPHLFAVCFETKSGFVTKPSPATLYIAPGAMAAELSNIATGPIGTVARRILATKTLLNYVGDAENQEYFFLARIIDNTTTTLGVDFFDSDLQASADYLYDQRSTIPACLQLTSYRNRMIGVNYDGGNSVVLVSKAGEPESFSEVDGFILVDPSEAGGVRTAIEFRDSLYIFKAFRAYVTQDLTGVDEPVLWSVVSVDKGVGTEVFGVSKIQDATGTNTDRFLIVDRSGLLTFDGVARYPALTHKVYDYWRETNVLGAHNIQVFNNPGRREIFVTLPRFTETLPNIILYGDYSDGLDAESIKWCPWVLPFDELSIAVDVDAQNRSFLRVGSTSGNIYDYRVDTALDQIGDADQAIDHYFDSPLIRTTQNGEILHFAGIRFRISGSAALMIQLSSEDMQKVINIRDLLISSLPGKHYFKPINFTNEKMRFRVRADKFGEYFRLNNYTVFAATLWNTRPWTPFP